MSPFFGFVASLLIGSICSQSSTTSLSSTFLNLTFRDRDLSANASFPITLALTPASIYELFKSPDPDGLKATYGAGSDIRDSLRMEQTPEQHAKIQISARDKDWMRISLNWGKKTFTLAALCIVLAVLFLLTVIVLSIKSCLRCCKVPCCEPKSKKEASRRERNFWLVTFFLVTLVWCFVLITGIVGSVLITRGVNDSKGSLVRGGLDGMNLLFDVPRTIRLIFDNTEEAVFIGLKIVKDSLDLPNEVRTIQDPVNALIQSLNSASEARKTISTSGASIQGSMRGYQVDKQILTTQFTSRFLAVSALSKEQITLVGGRYTINSALTGSPNVNTLFPQNYLLLDIQLTAFLAISLSSQLPDTAARARTIQGQLDNSVDTLLTAYDKATAAFAQDAATRVSAVGDALLDRADPLVAYSSNVDNGVSSTIGFYKNVIKYDKLRNTVFIIMFILTAISLPVLIIGTVLKKPRALRCCGWFTMIYCILLFVVTAVLLIVNSAVGDLCFYTDDAPQLYRLAGFISTLAEKPQLNQYARDFVTITRTCKGAGGVIDVAIALGLISKDTLDAVPIMLNKTVDLDYGSLTTGFDAQNSLTLGGDLGSEVLGNLVNQLGAFNFDAFRNEASKPKIDASAEAYIADLTALSNAITVNNLTSVSGNPNQNLNDFRIKLRNEIRQLSDLTSSAISKITAYDNNIISGTDNLQAGTNDLSTAVKGMLSNFETATGSVGTLTDSIRVKISQIAIPRLMAYFVDYAARNVTLTLREGINCRDMALDLAAVRNTMCVFLVGGFDGIWFAFLLYGLISIVSVIGFFRIAHLLEALRRISPLIIKENSRTSGSSNSTLAPDSDHH